MSEKEEINRRKVLKGIGGSTAFASYGIVLSSGTAAADGNGVDVSTGPIQGGQAQSLVGQAIEDSDTKVVLKKVKDLGFTPKIGHAIAKYYQPGPNAETENGVAIPLKLNRNGGVWSGQVASDDINRTVGYLTWESKSESARAVILGTTLDVSSSALINGKTSEQLQLNQNIRAMKIITPEETYSDTVSPNKSIATQEVTTNESVAQCVGDNLGLIEAGDDALACGSCLTPGDGLGVGDVAQCLWCLYEMMVNACVVGYCQKKNGGSIGETFCDLADTIANTPFYLLPISGTAGLKATAAAVSYGCSSDEGTDCTSPIIP